MKHILNCIPKLSPYFPSLAGALTLSLIFSAANVYMLPLTKDIIKAIGEKELTFYINQIANLWGLVLIRVIASKALTYLMSAMSHNISIDIQLRIYRKLLSASQHFYSDWKIGDLLTRLFSDTHNVKDGIIKVFRDLIPNTITFVSVLIYLLIMNWQLTTLTLISIPLFILIIPKLSSKLKRATSYSQRKQSDVMHVVQEVLSSIKLVQAYTMEDREHQNLQKECRRFFRASMLGVKVKIKVEFLIEFLQYTVMTLVIGYGGYLVTQNTMTPGELASFFTGIMLLIDPIITISKVITRLNMIQASAERVADILHTPILIESPKQPILINNLKGKVEFDHVSFNYHKSNTTVLNDISITVKPGESIALVGLSGAGKSTLINLIPRFYDPSEGHIHIDGINIKDMSVAELRKNIAIVPQEDILFRSSIAENIRYGTPHANIEEITQAAKKANAWEFIEKMPGKLRANIGDKGRKLSGGQRQRISIARAILRDPKILLLDEATSALDSKSEHLVQEALLELMKNRSTFVIAHRLSTIMHADNIIVLDDGHIVEVGKHDALLKKNGHYANLYKLQFKHHENKKNEE